jgi:hypothetical protein
VASVASTFFASLIAAPGQRGQPPDLVHGQLGEQAEEAPDIGILGVAPELPVFIGAGAVALSQMAPVAVLPILAPEAVVISGVVRPKASAPSMRRTRSAPMTMLPHWIAAAHLQHHAVGGGTIPRNHSFAEACS